MKIIETIIVNVGCSTGYSGKEEMKVCVDASSIL
jgi:hypothetical protein